MVLKHRSKRLPQGLDKAKGRSKIPPISGDLSRPARAGNAARIYDSNPAVAIPREEKHGSV